LNKAIAKSYDQKAPVVMLQGDNLKHLKSLPDSSIDLVVTSPPYNIGKDYEKVIPLDKYLEQQRAVIGECVRVLKSTGSICWQVGFTKSGKEIVPLDILLYPVFKEFNLRLKNRIVWTFGHGMHAQKRFSGRHETILWFVKNLDEAHFNLESVRVPQKYPGKRHYRGPKKGEYSGHPDGKNPGDVWEIPNVKAHHVEKTEHQCQFPIGLVQRLIRSLSPEGGTVLDPYSGVASTASAAILEGRKSVSIELFPKYFKIGITRANEALNGSLKFRPLERPIQEPSPSNPATKRFPEVEEVS
jgi:adenine-specific DNA-methyltransferase